MEVLRGGTGGSSHRVYGFGYFYVFVVVACRQFLPVTTRTSSCHRVRRGSRLGTMSGFATSITKILGTCGISRWTTI